MTVASKNGYRSPITNKFELIANQFDLDSALSIT